MRTRHRKSGGVRANGQHEGKAPEPDVGIVLDALKAMRRIPRIGSYVSARNQALLENEIGLGEYTWIYVIGYFAYIGERPVGFMSQTIDSGVYATRVFDEVEAMIRRHVEEAELPIDGQPDRVAFWRIELDAVLTERRGLKFEHC